MDFLRKNKGKIEDFLLWNLIIIGTISYLEVTFGWVLFGCLVWALLNLVRVTGSWVTNWKPFLYLAPLGEHDLTHDLGFKRLMEDDLIRKIGKERWRQLMVAKGLPG